MTEGHQDSQEPYQHQQRRCPRLGGPIRFGYCLKDAEADGPCWKILDCWWERFDVENYLRQRFGDAAVEKLAVAKPMPKVLSLLEQIQRAQQRCGDDS